MPYKDPEKRKEYHRHYKRTQRAGLQTPGQTLIPMPFRMKTAQDILREIGEQVALVKTDKAASKLEKARCIGYLCGIALRAVEAADIESRLAAVEDMLKQRKEPWLA